MTDSRLQELKRVWEASGSVEDEAAYLRERVRVKDLGQTRLEMAAEYGHAAARMVCPEKAKADPLERVQQLLARVEREARGIDQVRAFVVALCSLEGRLKGLPDPQREIGEQVASFSRLSAKSRERNEEQAGVLRALLRERAVIRHLSGPKFADLAALEQAMDMALALDFWRAWGLLGNVCRRWPESVREYGGPGLGSYLLAKAPQLGKYAR